jgi:hypothetical protein
MRSTKWLLALIAAVAAISLAAATPTLWAQSHSGDGKGGGGHESGSTDHEDGGHDDDSSHEGGKKGAGGAGGKGRLGAGAGRGSGHQSLRDVFKELDDEVHSDEKGPPAGKGKASSTNGAR